MRVGFIGLGSMGFLMARNLLEAEFEMTVHNRTREKEEPLAQAGARRAESPQVVASEVDVVITMVSADRDVEEVLFGPSGVMQGAQQGLVVVDASTIAPASARAFAARASEDGVVMLDAPVSGGIEGAEKGSLSIFVGGPEEAQERVRPVLQVLGSRITPFGPSGSGQLAKAANQIIVGVTFLAIAEGLEFALRAGLTQQKKLVQALLGGAAASWALENRGENIMRGDFPLGFRVSLHRKDLTIALEEGRRLGLDLPASNLVLRLENALLEAGYGDLDLSSLAKTLSGREGKPSCSGAGSLLTNG